KCETREAGGKSFRLGGALSIGDGLSPVALMPRALGPDVGKEQTAARGFRAAAHLGLIIGAAAGPVDPGVAARLVGAGVVPAPLGFTHGAPAAVMRAGRLRHLLARMDGGLADFALGRLAQ